MSHNLRLLFIVLVLFFGFHLVTGLYTCSREFCPGDDEKDYVYQVEESNGKTYIVDDGKEYTTKEWKQIHSQDTRSK